MLGGWKTPSVRNTVRLEMMFEKEIIKEKANECGRMNHIVTSVHLRN